MSTNIIQVDFKKALSQRYLNYALSTIMSRSLPDVRDGLKPVHRRLIYAMHQLKLNPQSGYKKCARVVGDVMGKFHPHGDAAIYNALVRLAQDFSVRYPLIDGQGNFGNIDGDNPASMRYTEAKLSNLATLLLDGIDQDAVDLRETYDGEEQEPYVLPSAFPNILANGATGIAVGMATSIPPHNIDELCQALQYLIDKPHASIDDLLKFIPGPDFPTGGVLCESYETIKTAYETGKGSFKLRSSWITETKKGGGYNIIITSMPYMVEKSKLIEKIADLIIHKKAHYLDDIIDESTHDIRIVLVPKTRNIDPQSIMESLFKITDLEVRTGVNLNVLDTSGTPKVLNLKEILTSFLNFRRETNIRLASHRKNKIQQRLEVLSGYLIVYLNLDEVIRIIRDEDHPKEVLIKSYNLTSIQVESILNMRLRSLRKLQEIEIKQEFETLQNEKNNLEAFLKSLDLQWKKIKEELKSIQKQFGKKSTHGERRTEISQDTLTKFAPIEIPIEREDVTIVCSSKGWIRSIKGHSSSDIRYKEGDEERFILPSNTADKLIVMVKSGRCFTIPVEKIPKTRGFGQALPLMIDLEPHDEIIAMHIISSQSQLFLIVSSDCKGFVIEGNNLLSQTKLGRSVMIPGEDKETSYLLPILPHNDYVAIIGENHKLLCFPITEVPQMTRGRGVTLQKYKDGRISDIKLFQLSEGLTYCKKDKLIKINDLRLWLSKRSSAGKLAPIGFPINNKFHN